VMEKKKEKNAAVKTADVRNALSECVNRGRGFSYSP